MNLQIECVYVSKRKSHIMYDGEKAAVVLLGKRAVKKLMEAVMQSVNDMQIAYPGAAITIQNDSDDPPLGIIIDAMGPDDFCYDSDTFWFDDYRMP